MKLSAGYCARPASLDDAQEIAAVMNAQSMAVLGRLTWAADRVKTEFASPGMDLDQDTQIISAADGQTAGFIMVVSRVPYVSPFVTAAVHPAHAGRGIGSALATWSEGRARRSIHLAPPGTQVAIGQEIWSEHTVALDLLGGRGYLPTRYFAQLQMTLRPALADPVVPEGIVVRPFRGPEELRPLAQAVDDAFRDHWGYVEQPFDDSLKEWEAWIGTSSRYDPTLWILATEGDQIAGAAIAEGGMEEDPQMAYVAELGVRRQWRGRGIGTALLLTLLGEFRRRGFERAALDVDADSLTGATRLYERVGFEPARQSIAMEKELRPGRDLRTQTAPT